MDPLRPFANLIQSLWKSQTSVPARMESAASLRPVTQEASPNAEPVDVAEGTLRSRIRTRLTQMGPADPQRTREVFVETVLAWELGDDLPRDPAFIEVVKRVADQLNAQPAFGTRLRSVLTTLLTETAERS
jgi:hypothetical protein